MGVGVTTQHSTCWVPVCVASWRLVFEESGTWYLHRHATRTPRRDQWI